MVTAGLVQHRGDPVSPAAEQPALDIALPLIAARPDAGTVRVMKRPPAPDLAPSRDPAGSDHGETPSTALAAVAEFHRAFGLPCSPQPTAPLPTQLAQLRSDLLVEEVGEFVAASATQDLVAIADALGDIVYVAYGAALTYGIDLDAVLAEVHRSNMSKLDEHGRPVLRSDGKVLKSSRYSPPDVAGVLGVQVPLPL